MFSSCYRPTPYDIPARGEERAITEYPVKPKGGVSYAFEHDRWDEETTGQARIAAGSAKLTFEYLNNKTEIFRPQAYTVRLWAADATADPSRTYVDGLGQDAYDRPTYVVTKSPNGRAYTRKTVKANWYLAEFDGSGKFFRFQAVAGSNGLLIYNENNWNSALSGYFASYGKVKVGWLKEPPRDATAILQFTGPVSSPVWINAEDGTTQYRGQFWFIPTGTYTVAYNIGKLRSATLSVAPGPKYPYLKMIN